MQHLSQDFRLHIVAFAGYRYPKKCLRYDTQRHGLEDLGQLLQHQIAAVGSVRKHERFERHLLARDKPIQCILEPAGYAMGIFRTCNDQSVRGTDLARESFDDPRKAKR